MILFTSVAVTDDDHSDDGVVVIINKVQVYIHAYAKIEYSSKIRIRVAAYDTPIVDDLCSEM